MKKQITVVTTAIINLTIGLVLMQFAHGQEDNNQTSEPKGVFKTYTNNDMNFTIQYPSNWQLREKEEYPKSVIFFIPDRAYNASFFMVSVREPEPYLDTDTMTLQNRSIEQKAQGLIDLMPENSQTLIRQNYVTVRGNDGLKVEYMDNENSRDYYGFQIFTNANNGNLYTLRYEEKSLKVPETLPLANKMVESFQVGVK